MFAHRARADVKRQRLYGDKVTLKYPNGFGEEKNGPMKVDIRVRHLRSKVKY